MAEYQKQLFRHK